ncbi:hypothetical protein B1B_01002, partial [mine drainage metagenome]
SVLTTVSLRGPRRRCPDHRQQPFRWSSPVLDRACLPGRHYDLKVAALLGLESLFLEETQERTRRHTTFEESCPSTGTVSLRREEFLLRAYALHRLDLPTLGKFLRAQGGYLLHVDGTSTDGSRVVFVAWDEWSGLVLDTRVLSTENAEEIAQFFRDLEAALGRPQGLVSDMGKGILTAVRGEKEV